MDILNELKKYFIVTNQNYLMPIDKDKKYTSSFLDNTKKDKRRYVIMDVNGGLFEENFSFFYIDIEKNKLRQQKSILIINKKSIMTDEKILVQEILFNHLHEWGHDWKENKIIKQKKIEVLTHSHSKNTNRNILNLIKKISKNFT